MTIFSRLRRGQGGFSLVELIVVIAVLGTLSLILVPQFSLTGDKAMGTTALSDAKTILTMAVAFNLESTEPMEQDDLNQIMGFVPPNTDGSGSKSATLVDSNTILYTYTRGGVELRGRIDIPLQHTSWSLSGGVSDRRREAIAEGLKIDIASLSSH